MRNWAFIRHFSHYFGSSILVAALGVIALPVYTRILTVSDYGLIGVFRAYAGIFAIVATLYFQSGMNRHMYEENLKPDDLKSFMGTTLVCIVFLQAVYFVVFYLFDSVLSNWLALPVALVRLLPFLSMALYMAIFWEQYYQAQKQSGKIAVIRLVQNYAAFGLAIFLVFWLTEEKYLGPVWGQVIVGVATVAYFFWDLNPNVHWVFRLADVRYLLWFSLPLLPYALSGEILGHFSRLAINSYQGAGDAGLYSLGYSIGAMLNLVWVSLQSAWMPAYYLRMNEGDYAGRDHELQRIVSFFLFAATAGILFGREVGVFLSAKSFHVALNIVPLIVVGQMYYGLFNVYALAINYAKRTQYLSIVVVGAGLLNIFLNIVLVPLYGFMAGAFALAVSYFVLLVAGWYVAARVIKVNVPAFSIVAGPTLWVWPFVALSFGLSLQEVEWPIQLGIKVTGLIISGMILFKRYISTKMIKL